MILGSAVMKLERGMGDFLGCEKDTRSGAGGCGEVRGGLIRDIIVYVRRSARGRCL